MKESLHRLSPRARKMLSRLFRLSLLALMYFAQGIVVCLAFNRRTDDLMTHIFTIWPGATRQSVTMVLHFGIAICRKLLERTGVLPKHRQAVKKRRR